MEYTPRLKKKYQTEVVNNLKGNYKSVMQVPKLVKICLNQGIGSAASDKKQIEAAQNEMTMITGQKAVLTNSTKDISNFKLRKGMPVGVRVTLRGDQMYEFLDRFVTSTLPRVRDFAGLPLKGFDGRGNYTMGIKEQIAFPEISIDKINKITGMDVTFVTSKYNSIFIFCKCYSILVFFFYAMQKKNIITTYSLIIFKIIQFQKISFTIGHISSITKNCIFNTNSSSPTPN